MNASEPCEIGPVDHVRRGRWSRVQALVNGRPIWFESCDAPLRPSAEAFLSALLVPALHRRSAIRVRAPLSPAWLANADKAASLLHAWWGYPNRAEITGDGVAVLPAARSEGGQCFSAGVDSFHSLLRGRHPTDFLVAVHGFDISHRDRYRMRRFRESLDVIGQTLGKRPIVVHTNLRKHRMFRAAPWEHTHGGALAAVGHLLADTLGSLVIPSSYPRSDPHPHGSHWDLDPLWSAENVRIIHDDPEFYRLDKLRRIDGEPLVQQHLRVCWQNFATFGNCSRCDKCVLTMLSLASRGRLTDYPVFDRHTPLPRILDALGPVLPTVQQRYRTLIEEGLPPDIEEAVVRLLARDRQPRLAFLRRPLRKAKLALARLLA